MLLAIDCGNTNIVFAVFDGDEIRGQWRASSKSQRTADEFGVWLNHLLSLEGLGRTEITAAVIASVVPAEVLALKTLCRRYFNCEAMVVGEPGVLLGLEIFLDQPREVGADRLVNAVAARAFHQCPCIVVDFGTATTFDVVDGGGNYRGGAIAPGIHQSLEALHLGAAQLPHIAIEQPERVIGTSTVTAMKSGIFWGYVGLIESLVTRIRKEFGAPLPVIATGGLAVLFRGVTDVIDIQDPDLTMRGLLEIHRRNVPR
ncbi:MAG: type III pantothenate kinase [Alphaproteobacteria bacterium]